MDPGGPRRRAKSEINVTPLIDIVLVLLIIFIVMVPSLSRVAQASLPRPTGEAGKGLPLVVSLDAEGQLRLQQEVLPLAELHARLAEALSLQPAGQRRVFLKVHPDLAHQHAVWALDQIRRATQEAKARTLARHGQDGGDVKVVVAARVS